LKSLSKKNEEEKKGRKVRLEETGRWKRGA
jgi:hypothetical protein